MTLVDQVQKLQQQITVLEFDHRQEKRLADQQHALVVELAAQLDHARAWCEFWHHAVHTEPVDVRTIPSPSATSDGWDGYLARMPIHE